MDTGRDSLDNLELGCFLVADIADFNVGLKEDPKNDELLEEEDEGEEDPASPPLPWSCCRTLWGFLIVVVTTVVVVSITSPNN